MESSMTQNHLYTARMQALLLAQEGQQMKQEAENRENGCFLALKPWEWNPGNLIMVPALPQYQNNQNSYPSATQIRIAVSALKLENSWDCATLHSLGTLYITVEPGLITDFFNLAKLKRQKKHFFFFFGMTSTEQIRSPHTTHTTDDPCKKIDHCPLTRAPTWYCESTLLQNLQFVLVLNGEREQGLATGTSAYKHTILVHEDHHSDKNHHFPF